MEPILSKTNILILFMGIHGRTYISFLLHAHTYMHLHILACVRMYVRMKNNVSRKKAVDKIFMLQCTTIAEDGKRW